jgi:hypothetical protein
MCYNCGCGLPDNDMGDSNNITEATFKKAAQASSTTVEEAKKAVLQELKKQLEPSA